MDSSIRSSRSTSRRPSTGSSGGSSMIVLKDAGHHGGTSHHPHLHSRAANVAYFSIDEIQKGNLHSSTAYTESYIVRGIKQLHADSHPLQQYARDKVVSQVFRMPTGECRFVVKHIRPECMDNHQDFEEAASLLENEATIMRSLQYESISTLRAISMGDSEAYYENGGRHDAYFLIVDKISERLDQKIKRWKKKQALMKVCQVGGLFGKVGSKTYPKFLLRRLSVSYEIADALEYMHKNKVAYRNFGLDKVGFNGRGRVLLTELGDAEKLEVIASDVLDPAWEQNFCKDSPSSRMNSSSERRTVTAYTAPEVIVGREVTVKSDVFAFTKVLSEILTLIVVGLECTSKKTNAFVNEFQRISKILPKELLDQMQLGASLEPENRPTMQEFAEAIDLGMAVVGKTGPRRSSSNQSLRNRKKKVVQERRNSYDSMLYWNSENFDSTCESIDGTNN